MTTAKRVASRLSKGRRREPVDKHAAITELVEQAKVEMRQGGWNEFNDLRQEAMYLASKWKLDHILPEWIKRRQ
jgi:hypothetical protein